MELHNTEEIKSEKEIRLHLRHQIRPVFEMLKSKKTQMNETDWTDLVRRIEQSIVNAPDQYLSDPITGDNTLILHYLFDEFLNSNTSVRLRKDY